MPEPLLLQLVANTKLFFDNQTWHNLILWLHYGQRTPAIAVVAGIEIILMGIFILGLVHLFRNSTRRVF